MTPALPTDHALAGLKPQAVWSHFATLCRIPRPSKHEGALREHLLQWARTLGLPAHIDAAGNLLIRKTASAGHEASPGVVLQAHLDMVCQANQNTAHDFFRDPIVPVCTKDGWVRAEHTTLGADNGLGVALMLALLADPDAVHGPLEALFTVDEEAGMGGAHGLSSDVLQGRLMLNLDTEEWGEFYLGCAGGLDVNVQRPGQAEALPDGWQVQRVVLQGLRGGHSGVNIHEERGNAIKLLVRLLQDLSQRTPMRLVALRGGTARNALPREASALVALPEAQARHLHTAMVLWQNLLRQELQGTEPGLTLDCESAQAHHCLSPSEQAVWLRSLHAAPHGVRRMSQRVTGVVETSNNLGMLELTPQGGECNFMVRSLLDSGSRALADELLSLWALSGTVAEVTGEYPGWTPNPDSPLLALCQAVYQREFHEASRTQVIHAGLECGIIAAKYPGMDIVSFGPTIRGAHAPGESVEIESVTRTWDLLRAIVRAVATQGVGATLHTIDN